MRVSSAGRERARRIRLHRPRIRLHPQVSCICELAQQAASGRDASACVRPRIAPVSLRPPPTLGQALLSLLSAMLYLVVLSARRYLVYLVRWHALVER